MSPKYLIAAALLLSLSARLSAQSVKAGIEAWQRGDYAGAVANWRPLAEKGDAEAAFNLAQAYRLGRGVPISLGSAQSWYERAAVQGSVDAQTNLGLLLFQNGDKVAGLKWLKKAVEQDDPRALLVFGTALYNGDGVPQDRLLGYAYVSRASQQGLAAAKDTLNQLDDLMSLPERQKAIALSKSMPKSAPPAAQSKPAKPVRILTATPKPKPSPPPATIKATPVSRPAAAGPVSGNWRIQLGAFSQRGAAEALYRRLSGKPALAGRSATYTPVGKVIRLQVGPFASRAAAASACASLGTACFPVPAK